MKHSAFRAILACLLCAAALLALLACNGGGTGDPPPAGGDKPPNAATLYLSFREQIGETNGRFAIRSSSLLQMGESAVRVELYAATDGEGIYQETDFSTDGKSRVTSHAYTDGALRSGGTVTPMTAAEYRASYGFPSLPELDAARLLSVAVHRELGGYCFTESVSGTAAGEFLCGALGRDLHALYAQAKTSAVYYTLHFKTDGTFDRLDIRAELMLDGAAVSLTARVSYGEFGTALPVPPAS